MKSLFIIMALFITATAFSQEKFLSFTKTQTGEEILIKENVRIRLKTIDGKRLKGRVLFTQDNMLEIKGEKVSLESIEKIKRNPLLLTIVVDGALIYYAGAVTIIGLYIYAFTGEAAFLIAAIPLTGGLIYATAKSPNIIPAYQMKNYKDIKIVSLSK